MTRWLLGFVNFFNLVSFYLPGSNCLSLHTIGLRCIAKIIYNKKIAQYL